MIDSATNDDTNNEMNTTPILKIDGAMKLTHLKQIEDLLKKLSPEKLDK